MTNQFRRYVALIIAVMLLPVVKGAAAGPQQEQAEWRTAYVTPSAVLDITRAGDSNLWAVGETGTILSYAGRAWQQVSSPTEETLHAVAFAPADDGWAVGEAGTLLHYNGGDWQLVAGPTTAADELFDLVLTEGGGWAVGQRFNTFSHTFQGLILRLSGGTWSVARVDSAPLRGVAQASANQVWAVGEAGTILHWDGGDWEELDETNADLFDVTVVGDDVWAVGDNGFIVRWNAKGVRVEASPFGPLRAIGFAGPTDGWVIGDQGTVAHYDGAVWSRLNMPISVDFSGLLVDTDGIPWVTGAGGVIGRVTPDGWQPATQPYIDVDLTAIDLVDAAGWAVGARPFQPGEGVVLWKFAGSLWHPQELPDAPPLFAIAVSSQDEAWATGQDFGVADPTEAGVVWHFHNDIWQAVDIPDVSALFGVSAPAPDDVWAAGQDGSLVHYDGSDWETVELEGSVHLYGLDFRTPADGWAVGERFDLESIPPRYLAVAYHYDGRQWEETPVPSEAWNDTTLANRRPRLLAVHGVSDGDVWAVGHQGAILHYDGAAWSVVQGKRDYNLLDVDFAGAGNGWAVGTQGTILRYAGTTWASVPSPTTETLKGIANRPDGEAWAVGSHGTFLYHPPAARWDVYLPLIGH